MRLRVLVAVLAVALAREGNASADVRVYEDTKDEEHPRSLDLYGWIQPRFVKQQRDERDPSFPFTPNPAFVVQRFRLGGIAQLDWWATARFELELAGAGTPPLLDAYLIARPLPEFAFSVGQMRVPISRQNLLPSKTFQLPDTAYFVSAKFLHDRDMGAMVSGSLLGDRIRYFAGVFDGNEPGRGNTVNSDKYFLFAGRVELSPLGPPPRFEGDLRPVSQRGEFLFNVSGSVMTNRLDDKHFDQTYYGADLALWFAGASLYAEYFYKKSVATSDAPPPPPANTTAEGWNIQAGYFPPLPWVEEHAEVAFRVERFDPDKEVKHPAKDAGERDLDQANPTWGYYGVVGGLNVFPTGSHDWKLQGSYEVRNETKTCLAQQAPPHCTGAIKNNVLVIQATGAF